MADKNEPLTVAEMRRRRRAQEALETRVKDTLDVLVVSTHKAATDAAAALNLAQDAADEALALAAKVYGSAKVAAELTGLPLAEVERAVKVVPAKRVKGLHEELQTKAEAKLSSGASRRHGSEPSGNSDDSSTAATPDDNNGAGGASVPGQVSTGPVAAADQSAASVS
ncbi:hypothetical protein ACIG5E_34450 [Kitasatospora sp. NPDC053057]|uniref:hypothetical protein n=1 Tax=Kitasatospora sp. NPDC053057 TaxID=3364062 RepID=UPI0037CBCB69